MHRVRSEGRLLDVLVRDGDFGRLYITYDVTTYATQETIALLVLALGVVAIVIIAGLAAFGISRRLVEPVTALADRLTQIDPGERHVRIGAQFAGNELEPIARSIDTFMERLDGFVEREQSFTATASHELRTPLAVIRGAVELLETHNGRSARQRARRWRGSSAPCARCRSSPTRCWRCRASSKPAPAMRHDLRRERSAPASGGGSAQRITGQAHRAADRSRQASLQVAAPESMVAMVIGNLVRNALQHGTGDEVAVPLARPRTGGDATRARCRRRISRAAPRRFTTHPGGHGMGLYLVRRICERYRWAIRLENTAGGVIATVG